MSETAKVITRYKLSEVQFRLLIDAQLRFDGINSQLDAARTHLTQIQSLVFDAHGITERSEVQMDPKTQELLVTAVVPTQEK
jgi:hypothetical protein